MTIDTELPAVKVKALEWVDLSTGSIAHTPFGIYQARWSATSTSTDRSHEMIIAGGQLAKSYHAGASEAKAAAQQDYEARILSALIPPPLPHVVGWIYEDELPEGYPYDEMYPFSRVDGVRLFPAITDVAALTLKDDPGNGDQNRRIAELVKALEQAKKRMRNCRGAIESNQVIDKDVHGLLTNGMADIDAAIRALIPREGEMNERIIGVAAKHPDGNVYSLLAPARHGQILRLIIAAYPDNRDAPHTCIQGFVTDGFRFVDRKEARTIADAAGQSSHRDKKQSDLFSEDLW
jgi:hypothetical protein